MTFVDHVSGVVELEPQKALIMWSILFHVSALLNYFGGSFDSAESFFIAENLLRSGSKEMLNFLHLLGIRPSYDSQQC